MEKINIQNIEEISLKNFFRILTKRKVAFIITFTVVFIVGLAHSFLVSPEYSSTSQVSLYENEVYCNEELYKYFPEDADSLWIIPGYKEQDNKKIDYIVGKLEPIDSELKSDMVLNSVLYSFHGSIDKKQLINSINVSIDRWVGIVTITTYSKTPDLAYSINKNILNSYIDLKKKELEKAYNILQGKIDSEIKVVDKELNNLSDEAESNAINFGIKWYDELSKLNLNKINLEFVNPILSKKIDEEFEKHIVLTTTKQNMIDNKDLFINRIEIIKSPELINVQNTSNYLRNILLSFVASILIGVIAAFIVNHFKTSKSN